MQLTVSSISLLLSAISLCVSLYILRRDKGLSALASAYMDPHEILGYTLGIYIVNLGRNPITVRKLVVETESGAKFEHLIRDENGNRLKLAQSEYHELILGQKNSALLDWAKTRIKSAHILDSYGRTWSVNDFAETINRNHHADKPNPAARPAF